MFPERIFVFIFVGLSFAQGMWNLTRFSSPDVGERGDVEITLEVESYICDTRRGLTKMMNHDVYAMWKKIVSLELINSST